MAGTKAVNTYPSATPTSSDTLVGVQGGAVKQFATTALRDYMAAALSALTPPGGTLAITGAVSTTTDGTFGNGAATRVVAVNGANTGSAGGAYFAVQNAGALVAALGNYSAVFGGAYDGTAALYSAGDLRINRAGTTIATVTATGLAVAALNATGNITSSAGYLYATGATGGNGYISPQNTGQTNIGSDSGAVALVSSGAVRATLDTSGNLLLGQSSLALTNTSSILFQVLSPAAIIVQHPGGTSGGSPYEVYAYNGAQIGSITQSGTSGVAFNTSSDRRLKTNVSAALDSASLIDGIQIVQHDWVAGGHARYGVIAQDLYSVFPEAVTAGDDGESVKRVWGVDYSKLVPLLTKEVQSLRTRVAQLETVH